MNKYAPPESSIGVPVTTEALRRPLWALAGMVFCYGICAVFVLVLVLGFRAEWGYLVQWRSHPGSPTIRRACHAGFYFLGSLSAISLGSGLAGRSFQRRNWRRALLWVGMAGVIGIGLLFAATWIKDGKRPGLADLVERQGPYNARPILAAGRA